MRERREGPFRQVLIPNQESAAMIYTIVIILLVLWAVGLVTSYTMGGLLHILLVVALIVLIVNFLSGRKSV